MSEVPPEPGTEPATTPLSDAGLEPSGAVGTPAEFESAVLAFLEPRRQDFNYPQLLETFLSAERFFAWVRVVQRRRPLAGSRVLSSGCGFGGSMVAYRHSGARVAVGAEVNGEYARFSALRTAELSGAGVVWYAGGSLPFRDEAFDIIESLDVVEHTPSPQGYLAELRRVLAPGGVILLTTPNRLWPVEQHLGIFGPPWLPVAVADAIFGALARLPWLGAGRRDRYRQLRGMRSQNVSFRTLRRIAKDLGLFLRIEEAGLCPRCEHCEHCQEMPLPRDPGWVRRMRRSRVGKFLAPSRTLVVTLQRDVASPAGG